MKKILSFTLIAIFCLGYANSLKAVVSLFPEEDGSTGHSVSPPGQVIENVVPTGNSVGQPALRDIGPTGQSVPTRVQSDCGFIICNPLGKTTSLKQVVLNVVSIVQILLVMAAVLYLIYAGFMFVTARGEAAKITKARNALLWGIIGLALVLGAQVIITAIDASIKGVFAK